VVAGGLVAARRRSAAEPTRIPAPPAPRPVAAPAPPAPEPAPPPAPAASAARRRARLALAAAALAVLAAAWVVAALALWDTQVPGDLPGVDLAARDSFGAADLDDAESFEALVRWLFIASQVVLVAVLAVYAKTGMRFAKESAAGPIGTGFLLGMLGLALVWLAQLPFGAAELWWARRHDAVEVGYLEWIVSEWVGLGAEFVFICLALLVVMGLARLLRRHWPLPAAAAFTALYALFAWLSPYLMPDLREARGPELRAAAERIADRQGVGDVPLRVQEVKEWTEDPNAYAMGIGATRRVVLWDTIVDFPRREVHVVVAHEYAHVAREHIAKGIGWFALFAVPATLLLGAATRRRGGLGEPAAVPLALLVVVVLQLVASPLQSASSRRYEAEADWAALRTTDDPRAMKRLFRRFTERTLADPDPPGWFHVLFDTHPSGLERVEMAEKYARLQDR
jgi:STE24 endopeptidase